MKIVKRICAALMAVAIAAVVFPISVYADTNGSEIKLIDQPDKLILQLGPQWAGVEFELKTDAGVFPVPVIVDSSGILQMDLGGSKTYILSCLMSPAAAPEPTNEPDTAPEPTGTTPVEAPIPEATKNVGIPAGQLVLFLFGLAAAAGGLFAMRYFKRRRETSDYDDDEDDYE